MVHIGRHGAPETAIDDRLVGEPILRIPEAYRGRSDKQDPVLLGHLLLIVHFEFLNLAFPAIGGALLQCLSRQGIRDAQKQVTDSQRKTSYWIQVAFSEVGIEDC